MAIAVAAMKEIAAGQGRTTPDFVKMFKEMNVQVVHLGEFHGDGIETLSSRLPGRTPATSGAGTDVDEAG